MDCEEEREQGPIKPAEIKLPQEFYAALLELPRCKIDGVCDGCGRCEH